MCQQCVLCDCRAVAGQAAVTASLVIAASHWLLGTVGQLPTNERLDILRQPASPLTLTVTLHKQSNITYIDLIAFNEANKLSLQDLITKYENSYHLPSTYVIFWDMLLLYRKYKAKEVVMLLQEFIEFSTFCQKMPKIVKILDFLG